MKGEFDVGESSRQSSLIDKSEFCVYFPIRELVKKFSAALILESVLDIDFIWIWLSECVK